MSTGATNEHEKAAELARLRDYLAELERGAPLPDGAPRFDEREIARTRARIAELEADLGI